MILLFGAGGQLGTELAQVAAARGIPLAGLRHGEADIADAASVSEAIARHRPTAIVNAAAWTKVDAAEQEPAAAGRANEEGPRQLGRAAAAAGVPVIHVSTDYVFDGTKHGAYREDDPIAPLGVYGATKAAGEAALRQAQPHHVIIRTSWVYGVHGANILKTALRLARERDELRFVSDQVGCPTATADLAAAVLAAAQRATSADPVHGTFHFAGTGATSWHGFIAHVVAAQAPFTGRQPRVTPIATADFPTPARRPANSELDSGLFARTFGVRALPWRDASEQVVRSLCQSASPA
ncbi:MAG: dTDP-4-dehydrorhamnose reductase [Alsobacter sp.]